MAPLRGTSSSDISSQQHCVLPCPPQPPCYPEGLEGDSLEARDRDEKGMTSPKSDISKHTIRNDSGSNDDGLLGECEIACSLSLTVDLSIMAGEKKTISHCFAATLAQGKDTVCSITYYL